MGMIIKSGQIFVEKRFVPAEILVEQGRIAAVGSGLIKEHPICPVMDLGEQRVLPGLIDTHIHGFAGCDTMDCSAAALTSMAKSLLAAGVTSFYPTIMTASKNHIANTLQYIGQLQEKETGGARILGAFAEGPFINEEHRGAQPLEAIIPIDLPWVAKLCSSFPGVLKKIILAPELPDAPQAARFFKEQGIVVALGHSSATYSQAEECAKAGAHIAVHTFNGMSGFHHREPGMAGAALNLPSLYAELICDGIHVHPAAMEVLVRCKGPEKVILISDCMRAGGMADGQYMLGDTKTTVKNGVARTESGALAGSTLKLIDGVKNAAELLHLPLEQAILMATENPARSMGIFAETGSIAAGKWADIIAIDQDFHITFSMVGGKRLK